VGHSERVQQQEKKHNWTRLTGRTTSPSATLAPMFEHEVRAGRFPRWGPCRLVGEAQSVKPWGCRCQANALNVVGSGKVEPSRLLQWGQVGPNSRWGPTTSRVHLTSKRGAAGQANKPGGHFPGSNKQARGPTARGGASGSPGPANKAVGRAGSVECR